MRLVGADEDHLGPGRLARGGLSNGGKGKKNEGEEDTLHGSLVVSEGRERPQIIGFGSLYPALKGGVIDYDCGQPYCSRGGGRKSTGKSAGPQGWKRNGKQKGRNI